ncbi:MAG TPA: aldo/keto reductase, partial [Armatimonadota bacterium]|nr:aldo/keto reductase [Armatimonadota bacterium]
MTTRPAFTLAPDGVDPRRVPARALAGGARMPGIGLGTFGSDHVAHETVAAAVLAAAAVGFRHFDCAAVYGN